MTDHRGDDFKPAELRPDGKWQYPFPHQAGRAFDAPKGFDPFKGFDDRRVTRGAGGGVYREGYGG
jgi:hypothetical protein